MKKMMVCAAAVLLFASAAQAQRVGQPTTEFELRNLAGEPKPYSPELVRAIGKPVILYFWATWCRPCVQELPSFVEESQKYPEVSVAAIAIADDPVAVRAMTSKLDERFPNNHVFWGYVTDDFDAPDLEQFNIQEGIPITVLIDRNARVVRRHFGQLDWKSKRVRNIMRALIDKK